MTFTEDGYFQYATVLSPLDDSMADSNLKLVDPVLYYLLRYVAGIIQIHIGDLWNTSVNDLGLTDLDGYVVRQAIAYDPLPLAPEDSVKFPLLAAYRKSETYKKETITWFDISSNIDILYMFPPLTSEQGRVLYPLLTHVGRVISDRIAQGVDSFYQDGFEPFKHTQLNHIGCSGSQYGKFPGLKKSEDSNIWFPSIVINVEMSERSMPVPTGLNFKPLTEIDGNIVSVVGDETLDEGIDIADFIAITGE